jgi:hypothetical protein
MGHPLTAVRRRAVLLASGAAVLLAVGGGTTAAMAATASGSPAPSATPAACRIHLRAELLGTQPAALKADLKTLRSEPKAQRAAERKVIRAKALSGAYGAQAEHLAHVVAGGKGGVKTAMATLPAAARADLKILRAMKPKSAERQAEMRTIEQKALSGGYGTAVQQHAKTVQARFQQRCAARSE